jgi:hypothetical protein
VIDMGELQICPLQDGAMRLRTAAVGFLIRTRSRRIIVDLGVGHEFELPTTLGQVSNLRVVDASIFPTVPRANTNLVTIMAGELMADRLWGELR